MKERDRVSERKREREMTVCMHLITLSCHGDTSPLQLLLYLKEFSQKMSSKTHEIEKQVDTLVHEAKVSEANIEGWLLLPCRHTM